MCFIHATGSAWERRGSGIRSRVGFRLRRTAAVMVPTRIPSGIGPPPPGRAKWKVRTATRLLTHRDIHKPSAFPALPALDIEGLFLIRQLAKMFAARQLTRGLARSARSISSSARAAGDHSVRVPGVMCCPL